MTRIVSMGIAVAGMAAMLLPVAAPFAAEQEFRIGPRIGTGKLRIDAGEVIDTQIVDEKVKEDTVGLGGTVEYKAPFGLVVEAGLFTAGTTDLIDSDDYRVSEFSLSLGYQIDLGRGFSITPRVGRSRWKLEADDDWFFDDDEDDNDPSLRGYQNYWEVSAMKRINRIWSLGVSHRDNHYDFGRLRSTVFTVMFNL